MFNRLNLGTRILLVILVPLFIFAVVISTNIYTTTHNNLMREKQSSLTELIDSAYGVIAKYYELYEKKLMPEEMAQSMARQVVNNMKFGVDKDDYFFILTHDTRLVAHPNEKLVGQDMGDYKDPEGKLLFKEIVSTAVTKGAGFVEYHWADKRDSSKNVPKLSYVRNFAPWKWALGTGIYINDVQEQTNREVSKTLAIIIIALVAIIIAITFFVKKSVVKPVEQIGQTLNNVSNKVANASMQLSEASQELSSSSSNEQAAATQESVSAMEEMSSMITQTNEFANQSQQIAETVQMKAREGNDTMNQLAASMHSIQEVNNQLQSIANIINDISNKTNIINDIVFKTQLLSFNASIEAARAGQHGKGFAVVAEEVGNLANMSGSAAHEIRELLESSKKHVSDIVGNTQKTVTQGQEVTDNALAIFKDITSKIESINEQIRRIVGATKEQSLGVQQTSEAMKQLDTTTKMNTQVAGQAAQNANSLGQSNLEVHSIVNRLNELIFGLGKQNNQNRDHSADHQQHSQQQQLRPASLPVSDNLVKDLVKKGKQMAVSERKDVSADDPDFR